jgi:hypothetical protein
VGLNSFKTDVSGYGLFIPTDPVNGTKAKVLPFGALSVSPDPTAVFDDTFETTTIDPNLWILSGTTPPSAASGVLSVSPGLAINGFSRLVSVPTFGVLAGAFMISTFRVILSAAASSNNSQYWGVGLSPTTPTTTNPITDGIGWEQDTGGALNAVVYTGGSRNLVATVSRPSDGLGHLYQLYSKGQVNYWLLDGVQVAFSSSLIPNVQTLPAIIQSVNAASVPGLTPVLRANAITVADTGRNATNLSDGTYPFRRAQVSAAGGLNVVTPDIQVGGTLAAQGATLMLPINGQSGVSGQISGTFVGTLTVSRSYDGGLTSTPINAGMTGGGGNLFQTFTAPTALNGIGGVGTHIILTMTSYTSGAATCILRAGAGVGGVFLVAPLPSGVNVIGKMGIDQTTPGTSNAVQVAGSLPAGTNTLGTMLPYRPPTANPATVAASATSVTLLTANTARAGATVTNNSSATLYLSLGTSAASSTNFTFVLGPLVGKLAAYYELPFGYAGAVTGIWDTAAGSALIRELV